MDFKRLPKHCSGSIQLDSNTIYRPKKYQLVETKLFGFIKINYVYALTADGSEINGGEKTMIFLPKDTFLKKYRFCKTFAKKTAVRNLMFTHETSNILKVVDSFIN